MAAAFDDIGLTRTADTGQINWTTVALPADNTFAGYEIRQFTDPQAATEPVIIKLEYGLGFNDDTSRGDPKMRVQVGRASNGAGSFGPAETLPAG